MRRPSRRVAHPPATACRGLTTPTYIIDSGDGEGRYVMRKVLTAAAETIGYALVTGIAVWLVFQHVPYP